MCLVYMNFWKGLPKDIPMCCSRAAAAGEEGSMPVCCIILRRYGAAMTQMRLSGWRFSTEHLSLIQSVQWVPMYRPALTIKMAVSRRCTPGERWLWRALLAMNWILARCRRKIKKRSGHRYRVIRSILIWFKEGTTTVWQSRRKSLWHGSLFPRIRQKAW